MTDKTIESIANKHLGKTADGSTMKAYETPDTVDPSLLVGVPRHLNRQQYNIKEDDLPFVGVDSWNAYEFSCLLDNGFPVSGLLRFVYSANSANIVESKSMKLYLNSFNMAKMGRNEQEALDRSVERIRTDLISVLGLQQKGDINICIHVGESGTYPDNPLHGTYTTLEDVVDIECFRFDHYNESPDILKVIESSSNSMNLYHSRSLRSNCRVTNQPDWGDVFIYIQGSKTVTYSSLLQYIVSMRKENHFHEEICECIYKRLHDLLDPTELAVACLYTRRGGIDINPIRASNMSLVYSNNLAHSSVVVQKTMRQ